MSGFLHRLAAQAMGSTNTLRSAVRTPYSAPLSPVNGVAPEWQAPSLDIAGNERQHSGNSGAEWASVSSHEQHRVNTYKEIGAQPRNNEVTPPSPESSHEEFVVQSDRGIYTEPDRPSGISSSPKAMLRSSSIDKTIASEPSALVEGIEMHIPGNNSTTLPDSNYPSPLLPLKNATNPSAMNASAAAQHGERGGSSRQGRVDEITEVHVSIGRIEVTAVHESPAPKRQAPIPAKPLSLNEYLARRGRGT